MFGCESYVFECEFPHSVALKPGFFIEYKRDDRSFETIVYQNCVRQGSPCWLVEKLLTSPSGAEPCLYMTRLLCKLHLGEK